MISIVAIYISWLCGGLCVDCTGTTDSPVAVHSKPYMSSAHDEDNGARLVF